MFIEPNPFDGDMPIKTDRNAIRESIRNCILTTVNERPFEPYFGTRINSAIFESIDDAEFYLDSDIVRSVYSNDSRVFLGPRTYSLSDQTVTVHFDYEIKALGIRENIKISLERTR